MYNTETTLRRPSAPYLKLGPSKSRHGTFEQFLLNAVSGVLGARIRISSTERRRSTRPSHTRGYINCASASNLVPCVNSRP